MTTAPSRKGPINPKYQIMKFSETIKQIEAIQSKAEEKMALLQQEKENLVAQGADIYDERLARIYGKLADLYDIRTTAKNTINGLLNLQEAEL